MGETRAGFLLAIWASKLPGPLAPIFHAGWPQDCPRYILGALSLAVWAPKLPGALAPVLPPAVEALLPAVVCRNLQAPQTPHWRPTGGGRWSQNAALGTSGRWVPECEAYCSPTAHSPLCIWRDGCSFGPRLAPGQPRSGGSLTQSKKKLRRAVSGGSRSGSARAPIGMEVDLQPTVVGL